MRSSDIYVSFSTGFQQFFAGSTKLYEHVSQRTYYCMNPLKQGRKANFLLLCFCPLAPSVMNYKSMNLSSSWIKDFFRKKRQWYDFRGTQFPFLEHMISLKITVVINFIQAYMSNRNCYYLSYEKWSVNSFSIRWTVIKELTTHRKDLLVSFYELLVCYLLV